MDDRRPIPALIESIACYIPPGRLENRAILEKVTAANRDHFNAEELDELLYSLERKFDFLGIKTRAFNPDSGEDNFISMAVKAGEAALAGRDPAEIDCVILSGVTNPFREPPASCIVAGRLGMERVDFMDLNDTCNGFLKALDLAALYLQAGRYRRVLVIAAESPYEIETGYAAVPRADTVEDFNNRMGSLIVGAGAAAWLLGNREPGAAHRFMGYKEKKETRNWDASLLHLPGTRLPETKGNLKVKGFWSDARLISQSVIRELPGLVAASLEDWGLTPEDVNYCFLHQLGNNVTFATLDKIGLDHTRAPVNTFAEFGNLASANIPVNLALAAEKGLLRPGDKLLLLCSACGLTYSTAYLKW